MSSDLTDGMTATAANNDSLSFSVSADGVMVNGANVPLLMLLLPTVSFTSLIKS